MKTKQGLQIAEVLFDKCYGDVSEYKAEIERLKSEIIKQDQVIIERNFELVELEYKIKQAQIDKMAQAMCGFCTEDKRCVLKYSAPYSEVASQDCSYKESAEELICKGYGDVKQAKIDVLNEVKKCSQCDNFFPDGNWHRYVLVSDIDILIKEIEK